MGISFNVFYQWKNCRILWMFDCVVDKTVLPGEYKWSLPDSEKTLLDYHLLGN